MEQQVSDSIRASGVNSVQDTLPQTEYLFGKIIPYSGKSEADLLSTTSASGHRDLYGYLKRDPGKPFPGDLVNTDFSFGILTLSLLIITILVAFAGKDLRESFLSLSIRRYRESPSSSSSVIISWPPVAMNFFTLLSISLFATIAAAYTGAVPSMPGGEMIGTVAICFAIFTGILVFRHITCIMVAAVTGQKKLFMEYVAVVYNTWFIAALSLFVLSSLIIFAPLRTPLILVYSGCTVIVLLLIHRTIRLLNIFIIRRVPILYFILYLCALEVLPVLIVLKILGVF